MSKAKLRRVYLHATKARRPFVSVRPEVFATVKAAARARGVPMRAVLDEIINASLDDEESRS